MKSTFALGFLLGFFGLLAGVALFPVVDHARIASLTSVALNGGRTETFLIRLPVDRISSFDDGLGGVRGGSRPAGINIPDELGGTGLLIEHFKLRDIEGNVIGMAAHHSTRNDAGALSVWALNIPGRGTVVFSGPARPPNVIDTALSGAGRVAGQVWDGELSISAVPDGDSTSLVGGTEEFENVGGRFEEVWSVTGVSATGEIRGTVELRTIVSLRS